MDVQVSVQQLQPIRRYSEPLAALATFMFPTLAMPSAPSFIAQWNGLTRIMFTLWNRVDRKRDGILAFS